MSSELARSLLLADAITPEGLARALFATLTEEVALEEALVSTGAIDERRLQDELARWDGPTIQNVAPVPELVERLPAGLCRRLLALPIRVDPRTGTVDVAVADGRDPHPAAEVGHHLRAPVRAVRARLSTLIGAIERLDQTQGAHALAAPMWVPSPHYSRESQARPASPKQTPLWGTPIVNLERPPPPSVEMPIPLMRRAEAAPATLRDPEPVFPLPPSSRTSRSRPKAPAPLPLPDVSPVIASLEAAGDRDSILAIMLSGVRGVARRVALLVVKRDVFIGWSCSPELGSAERLRELQIPTNVPSVFATVAASGASYLGPVFDAPAHEGFVAVCGALSRDVAVAPVRVAQRPAVLIVADELADTALSTKHIDEIAEAGGQALTRLLRKR